MTERTKVQPINTREVARNIATVRKVLEIAGLHRCTEHPEDGYCGCAPGRCASRRETRETTP